MTMMRSVSLAVVAGTFERNWARIVGVLGLLTLFWACYPARTSYTSPQDSTVNQWLIEFRTGEDKVQMTFRYSAPHKNDSGWSSSNHSFLISPDQLQGLTRAQAMSSGTHVQFQLKRDAGTFNCDGWFKDGNGAGHFTKDKNTDPFTP